MKQLILASASPRRKELLEMTGRSFVVETSAADERLPEGIGADRAAEYLSGIKAQAVMNRHENGEDILVIGSDTIVVLDGEILGKPKDKEDAFYMLSRLSGRTHTVYTGVTLLMPENRVQFQSATEVEFYPLNEEEIRSYIESGEPMDKAGAYGIQGLGAMLVKEIRGDYYTVVGFPIAAVERQLRKWM